MAVITMQFGQCGNQVGQDFFSTIWKDIESNANGLSSRDNDLYRNECLNQWFMQESRKENRWYARSVLVDTENKVVNGLFGKQKVSNSWMYNLKCTAVQSGGAGNNWSLGYQRKGPELLESVSESLRHQAENSDRLLAVLNILSSAGGTGSGVGSFIIENIRDDYPTKLFVNTVVLPFESGEVVTQSYNTLLTLAKVYSVSDATLLIHNDHLHKMATTLLHLKTVGINDLNSLIAQKMVSLYQVPEKKSTDRVRLPDLISHMSPHPAYKFFMIKTSPHVPKENKKFEGTLQWPILINHLRQTLRISSVNSDGVSLDWELKPPSSVPVSKHNLQQFSPSVANVLVTRGVVKNENELNVSEEFLDPKLYPNWIPCKSAFLHTHVNRRFNDLDKFAAFATNNSKINVSLNAVAENAWKMFTHKAYLHQYTKYGMMEEDFIEAFVRMESVVKAYKEL